MITVGNTSIQGTPSAVVHHQRSELPYDLLGKIYPRLDARTDRVRFAAVCTPPRGTRTGVSSHG
jgi:hypothetical protein